MIFKENEKIGRDDTRDIFQNPQLFLKFPLDLRKFTKFKFGYSVKIHPLTTKYCDMRFGTFVRIQNQNLQKPGNQH